MTGAHPRGRGRGRARPPQAVSSPPSHPARYEVESGGGGYQHRGIGRGFGRPPAPSDNTAHAEPSARIIDQVSEITIWLTSQFADLPALHAQLQDFIHEIKSISARQQSSSQQEELSQAISAALEAGVAHPYITFLHLITTLHTRPSATSPCSLPGSVWKTFASWSHLRNVYSQGLCDRSIKFGLLMATLYNNNFLEMAKTPFKLLQPAALPAVRRRFEELRLAHRHSDAASLVAKLRRQLDVDCGDFMFLTFTLLQNSVNVVTAFLDTHEELQRQYMISLDSFFATFDASDAAVQFSSWQQAMEDDIPSSQRTSRSEFSKRVNKLIKRYSIPLHLVPHFHVYSKKRTLNYLVQSSAADNLLHSDDFLEFVEKLCGDHAQLQEYAISWTLEYETPAAVRLSRHLRMETHQLPEIVHTWSEDLEMYNLLPRTALPDSYSLPTATQVIMVDNMNRFHVCLDLLRAATTAGLDCEWTPVTDPLSGESELELVQLAVEGAAMLVDVPALRGVLQPEDWSEFGQTLAGLRVIGFGSLTDRRLLAAQLPHLSKQMGDLLDLDTLNTAIGRALSKQKISLPVGDLKTEAVKGLAGLVMTYLRLSLDKGAQMTNWSRRPLKESQIRYAAIDAYVLLDLFAAMTAVIQDHKLEIEKRILEQSAPGQKATPPKSKTEKRKAKRHAAAAAAKDPLVTGVRPPELRLLVDQMILGLGYKLRQIGVDVEVSTFTTTQEMADEAKRSSRIVLTAGFSFIELAPLLPDGTCVSVPLSIGIKEQISWIIKHFKLNVKMDDILGRCTACNRDDFTIYTREEMRTACRRAQGLIQPAPTAYLVEGPTGYSSNEDSDDDCAAFYMDRPRKAVSNDTFIVPGVRLRVETIFENMLEANEVFHGCKGCGRVYWDGSHHGRVAAQYSYALPQTTFLT